MTLSSSRSCAPPVSALSSWRGPETFRLSRPYARWMSAPPRRALAPPPPCDPADAAGSPACRHTTRPDAFVMNLGQVQELDQVGVAEHCLGAGVQLSQLC